eukprot:COSAG06_NODE_3942_length_4741_cov_2.299009_6_plen_101_part_00
MAASGLTTDRVPTAPEPPPVTVGRSAWPPTTAIVLTLPFVEIGSRLASFLSRTVPAAAKVFASSVFFGVQTLAAALLLLGLSNAPTANNGQRIRQAESST